MEKLISMVEFTLNVPVQGMEVQSIGIQGNNRYQKCIKYANFLKQKLELWMFVPSKFVDGEWVVLEEPKGQKCCGGIQKDCGCMGELWYNQELLDEYLESKSKVLFEGFYEHLYSVSNNKIEINLETLWFSDIQHNGICYGQVKTVEDLIQFDLNISETAKNQLSLTTSKNTV